MEKIVKQSKLWAGAFGKEYTDRNTLSAKELDRLYKKNFGITRTALNEAFIGKMDRDIKILEVGSNNGNQLGLLQKMGFKNLYGIELNGYAVELSKVRMKGVDIIQGSVFDIPFKDGYFDLVFTSGVLVHIAPLHIKEAMREIYRCTKKYIFGFEYYSDKYIAVAYRGQNDMLWKADFAKLYIDLFAGLKLIKQRQLKYLCNDNVDIMFLLRKSDGR